MCDVRMILCVCNASHLLVDANEIKFVDMRRMDGVSTTFFSSILITFIWCVCYCDFASISSNVFECIID